MCARGGGGTSPGDNLFFLQFDSWLTVTVTVTGCLACPIWGSLSCSKWFASLKFFLCCLLGQF